MINFAFDELIRPDKWRNACSTAMPRSAAPHYWFEKNSIDINLMTLDEAINSKENFVYTLSFKNPWNISKYLKEFSIELIECINSGRCNFVINDAMEGRLWNQQNIKTFLNSLSAEVIAPSTGIVLTQSWSYLYNNMPFRMVHWAWFESIMSDNAKPIEVQRHNLAKKLCSKVQYPFNKLIQQS